MAGKQIDRCISTRNYRVFILLQAMVFLLVSTHDFSIVSLTDCTQKVPLYGMKKPTRYSANIFSCDS